MEPKRRLTTPLAIGIVVTLLVVIGIYFLVRTSEESDTTTDTNEQNVQNTGATGGTQQNNNLSATNNTGTQTVAGWTTYTNPTHGYSIRYPSNWVIGDVSAPNATPSPTVFAVHSQDGGMSFKVEVAQNQPTGLTGAQTQTTINVAGKTRRAYMFPSGRTGCSGGAYEDCSMFIVPVSENDRWYVMTADGNARNVAGVYLTMLESFTLTSSVSTTFENKIYGFKFSYPSDWKVTDVSENQNGQKIAAVQLRSPVRYNVNGYEQTGVQFLLHIRFADGQTSIVDQGFVRADTSTNQAPTKVQMTPAALQATAEYKTGQQIISSVTLQ